MKQISFLILSLFFFSISHHVYAQIINITAVGDVLLHKPLQRKGLQVGFHALWEKAIPLIQQADIAYANLEGPAAKNVNRRGIEIPHHEGKHNNIYSSFPLFNYPPQVIKALKQSGFDIVSTANNHSLDRFALGIDKTIDTLNTHNLLFTGTKKRNVTKEWYTIVQKKGLKIAFLACTQDTNGIKDNYQQVLYCYKKNDKQQLLELINSLKQNVDLIIVTPHFGKQYQFRPNRSQRAFAKQMLDAGASIVLGSHPHVVQPFERYQTKDGRDTFIAYSLGNFVSNQGSIKNRSSGLLQLTIDINDKHCDFKKITYIPTYMENRQGNMTLTFVHSKKEPSYRLLKRIVGEKYLHLYDEINKEHQ